MDNLTFTASFYMSSLHQFFFKILPPSSVEYISPFPLPCYTLKSSRYYLQQVLRSICVHLDWATVLGYYPFGSQGCSWWSRGHGKPYDLLGVTRKQLSFNFFPGWVINSRFRGAVMSSVIVVGVSLFCEQSEHVLNVRPRGHVPSLMSGVFPYANIKPSWHLLLNLLRKVPLHPGDSITFQVWFLPCHTARSSLYMAGVDLGNDTISELLWLSSPTWFLVMVSILGPQQETKIYFGKTLHPLSFSTAPCSTAGNTCPPQNVCQCFCLGLTWPYPES